MKKYLTVIIAVFITITIIMTKLIFNVYTILADTSYIPKLLEDKKQINILSNYSSLYTKTNEMLLNIQQDIIEKQNKLNAINNQKLSLQRDIEAIDLKINILQQQKKEIELKIDNVINIIDTLNNKIIEYQKKIDEYKLIVQNILQLMNKENLENGISILIKSNNLSDLIMFIKSSVILEQYCRKIIEDLFVSTTELQQSKQFMQIQKQSYNNMLEELKIKDNEMKIEKQKKDRLLEITKGNEQIYINMIDEAKKQQEEIKKLLLEIENDFSKKYNNGLKHNLNIGYEENLFNYKVYLSWPIETRPVDITAFFEDDSYKDIFGFSHDAIDIKAPQETPILSAEDGYVFEAKDNGMGYNYIIIAHNNGIFTLYGHVSKIMVSQGDTVSKGQVIGLSGGTPNTAGAGPFTSGPHIHFEVHYQGKAQDPLLFLDLKDMNLARIPDNLLDRYKFRIKQMMIKNPFILLGENESERREYLLQKYATPDFQDKNMWIKHAISGNIDPDLVICIGFAETTLGNYLKSINNVGNVGNNDRGNTVVYQTPEDGIKAIVDVLNNSYLGKYNTIGELSRWGNKEGPIYASSTRNWFINVSKCMSAIKGGFVDDDYRFRIEN